MIGRKHCSVGLEVSATKVRALALTQSRSSRAAQIAEVDVAAPERLGAAMLQALAEFPAPASIRVVLLGSGARTLFARLPKMSAEERESAVLLQSIETFGETLDGQAWSSVVGPADENGQHPVTSLFIERESIDSWSQALTAAGHEVSGVGTPLTLVPAEALAEGRGVLWAQLGKRQTTITLWRGFEPVLSREIARDASKDEDELVGAVERQLADFQEIERSILYYRQNFDRRGVHRVVFQGDPEQCQQYVDQLAPALRELEVEVALDDVWRDLPRPESMSAIDAQHWSLALAAADAVARPLFVVPSATLRARQDRRRKRFAASSAWGIAATFAAVAFSLHSEQSELQRRLEAMQQRERQLLALPKPSGGGAESVTAVPATIVRPELPPPPDWSTALREVGLLARQGVEIDKLDLAATPSGADLTLWGHAASTGPDSAERLLSELQYGLAKGVLARGLPRIVAQGSIEAGHDSTQFVIEIPITDQPAADRGTNR